MTAAIILKELKEKMQKVVQFTLDEFATIHTGKASASMVEQIIAEVYGSPMRIRDVAAITTPDPRTISIQPWDKGAFKAVEKALIQANLGFMPLVDADRIRCIIPEMSQERRREMTKKVNIMAENGRVSTRSARRDAMESLKALEKEKVISEDELKRLEKDVQKITDDTGSEINRHLAAKEKDLLTA